MKTANIILTELVIKNTLSEILFNKVINESVENQRIVNYLYNNLVLEKLLYGEPLTIEELRKLLRKKILNFKFIKLDGEVRPAKGTLLMNYIPQRQHPKGIRPSSPKVATFFDLIKKDWRSVSQRSKEIVLDKDEKTGKPTIMVKDKPEGKEVPVTSKEKQPEVKLNVGDIYNFTKTTKVKYKSGDTKQFKIPTFITITRKTDEGYWGTTAGSKLDILLTPERLERLGDPMNVGDEYEFTHVDSTGKKTYTEITIVRKDNTGTWGVTKDTGEEILLDNDELKNVHKYEQPEATVNGEPLEPAEKIKEPEKSEVKNVKAIKSTDVTKMYHLVNPKTGVTQDIEMAPKDLIGELKRLGPDWELQTEKERNKKEEEITSAYTKEKELHPGENRNYTNRFGKNIPIEIVSEDPNGITAKTKSGTQFKIPLNKSENIGGIIPNIENPKTNVPQENIIKGEDLENIDASEI